MEQFDSTLSSVIDSTLGLRCRLFGYQYSEIIRSLMSIYFCGGSCIEDVTTHLMNHLSLHPTLRTCSSDTILRAIKELTQENYWFEFNLISAALWVSIFYKYLSNKSCSGLCHVRFFTYLSAAKKCCKKKYSKISEWHGKSTNKIREAHSFWRNLSNHGAWLSQP